MTTLRCNQGTAGDLSNVLAKELGGRSIWENAMLPGAVDTQLLRDNSRTSGLDEAKGRALLRRPVDAVE
jgi:hypothetical protein